MISEEVELVRLTNPALTSFDPGLLHYTTEPEAIRDAQRQVIRLALYTSRPHVPTPEELSALVDLPMTIIVARLEEMKKIRSRKLEASHAS